MVKSWTDAAWDDYLFWQSNDRRMLKRINQLIKDAERAPYDGIGRPEPLKHDLQGLWSRRIDGGHRLVYRVQGDEIIIYACRTHYE